MTDDEMSAFLRDAKTMTIVSNGVGGFPHPMPMWFAIDDDRVVSMTTFRKSQKVKNLQRDPRVALLVESGTEYSELRGVVFYGTAEVIDDLDTVIDTLLRIAGNEVPESDTQARRDMTNVMKKTAEKRICIRVKPDRIVSWDHAKLGGNY